MVLEPGAQANQATVQFADGSQEAVTLSKIRLKILDGRVRNDIADSAFPRTARITGSAATGALVFAIRGCALALFLVMSMAEPFLAVVLSALALGCFFVAVLFGFIFHAPFPHRWFVLGRPSYS